MSNTINYSVETELMKNQKAAQVLAPASKFQSLQTTEGLSLFFSIGDDGVLYLYQEQAASETGWKPIDLSSSLLVASKGNTMKVKTFATTQNLASGKIAVAIVLHDKDKKQDAVFTMCNLDNSPNAGWYHNAALRPWKPRPYDDSQHPIKNLDISFLDLEISEDEQELPILVAGIEDDQTKFIQNYSINIDPNVKSGVWSELQTAENYDTMLSMKIGKPKHESIRGTYALYSLSDNKALTYTPLRGTFGPPTVTKLTLPEGASSIAVLPTSDQNTTDLFVAGDGAIYYFAADNQKQGAQGVKIIENNILAGIQKLNVHKSEESIVLWGLNNVGQLFYSYAPYTSRMTSMAWSYGVAILEGVSQITSLINSVNGSNEIFAHTGESTLVKLMQDVETSIWHQRSITLPTLDIKDVFEYYSFTTHISLTDDSKTPVTGSIQLSSSARVGVFINDQYVNLSPDVIKLNAGHDGIITIIQETQSLGAITYKLLPENQDLIVINPMTNVIHNVGQVTSGQQLNEITLTDEYGNQQKLVPKSEQKNSDALVAVSQQLVKASKKLQPDGSVLQVTESPHELMIAKYMKLDEAVGVRMDDHGTMQAYHGDDIINQWGLQINDDGTLAIRNQCGSLENIAHGIKVAVGDFVRWFKHAIDEIKCWLLVPFKDVFHFIIQIAGEVFYFIIQAITDVAHGIQFIFNKIKAGLEKLVQWLGFIFEWHDIIRTHKVIKSCVKNYLNHAVHQIPKLEKEIKKLISEAEHEINQWAGLESLPNTKNGESKKGNDKHRNQPQANWGVHHTKSNYGQSNPIINKIPDITNEVKSIFEQIEKALIKEGKNIKDFFEAIKSNILDKLGTISIGQIIKELLAILADFILNTVEDLIFLFLNIIELLVKDVVELLDKPMNIPVISWIYSKFTDGSTLSILDLGCLIAAIPATIIYKLVKEKTPYPDDQFTHNIIHASSFKELQQLFAGSSEFDPGSSMEISGAAKTLMVVFEFGSSLCSFVSAFLAGLKLTSPPEKALNVTNGVFFFLTTGPNLAGSIIYSRDVDLFRTAGFIIYFFTTGQKMLDIFTFKEEFKEWAKVSPYVDCVLGTLSLVPVGAGLYKSQSTHSIFNFLAGLSWNISRIITPGAKDNEYVLAGKLLAMSVYGVMEFFLARFDADDYAIARASE